MLSCDLLGVTPCSDVVGYRRFGGSCYFHLQGKDHISPLRKSAVSSKHSAVWETSRQQKFNEETAVQVCDI